MYDCFKSPWGRARAEVHARGFGRVQTRHGERGAHVPACGGYAAQVLPTAPVNAHQFNIHDVRVQLGKVTLEYVSARLNADLVFVAAPLHILEPDRHRNGGNYAYREELFLQEPLICWLVVRVLSEPDLGDLACREVLKGNEPCFVRQGKTRAFSEYLLNRLHPHV